MSKIIKINDTTVTIGKGFLTFVPSIGKKVEVYTNGNDYTVIPIESEVPQSVPTPAAPPAQPQIIINNSNSNQNINLDDHEDAKQINKWTAFLICWFFGWAGIHRFYEGKIATGVLWLCTFGLIGVGWFIDWLIILFKPNPYYVRN
ncbi:MAG: TM2 domain-containing protein [Fibrobacteraceae bacterium]|nr:TM2 domain-containing protein [Fibrobacteraceae bacterium]